MSFSHRLLLTGTPVQNNLLELYSLLCFVAPSIFRYKYVDDFVNTFSDLSTSTSSSDGLTKSTHLFIFVQNYTRSTDEMFNLTFYVFSIKLCKKCKWIFDDLCPHRNFVPF